MQDYQLRSAFAHAWSQLLDYSMPGFLKTASPEGAVSPLLNAAAMVLLGTGMGICCWVVEGILSALLPRVATAVLFGVATTILITTKDSGRGLATMLSLVNNFSGRQEEREHAFDELDMTIRTTASPLANLVTPAVLGIYFITFFLMAFFGYTFFIIAVFTADTTAQTCLAMLPKRYGNGPLLNFPGVPESTVFATAGIVLLFPFALYPIATVTATLVATAGVLYLKKIALTRHGGVDPALVTLGGAYAALAMLVVGTLAKL